MAKSDLMVNIYPPEQPIERENHPAEANFQVDIAML
jgi:hypothetical protein